MKKSKIDEFECPICKRIKHFDMKPTGKKFSDIKKEVTKDLISQGYSYRQVANLLGYKSPMSVSYNLGKIKR